eukprot:Gb_35664 [translate_table: standard]
MASRHLSAKLGLGAVYTRIQSSFALAPASVLRNFNSIPCSENNLSEEDDVHSAYGNEGSNVGIEVDLSPEFTAACLSENHENDNSNEHPKRSRKTPRKWRLHTDPSDDIFCGQDSFTSLGFQSQNLYAFRSSKRFTLSEQCTKLTTGYGISGLPRGSTIGGRIGGWTATLGGPMSVRYASTIGEGSEKVDSIPEYISDVAEVFTEKSVDAVVQTQAMSEVAIAAADSAYPVAALQYVIEAVHVHSGLPWWASIVATTLLIRSLTVPILISQLKATSRLTMMRPQLEEVTQQMKQSSDPQTLEEGRRRVSNLFKEHGVTPFTPMKGIFIQGPIFISFYLAITNMAAKVPSFKEGGALWFQDLSTPDSLYILPVLTGLSFLATVELNMQEGLEGNPMAGNMKKFSRFIALITVPITMNFPKAIFCYWITSNLFSLAHGAVIRQPGVKKALGIPDIPVPKETVKSFIGSPETTEKEPPSSSLVHQRLRALERTVKARKHGRKR